ncbi:MAG: hypothetical protein VX815_17600 [Gemmatimonadota bacterium]|nr:hypothetical protein [Gemmatimonadota bacterium]
MGLGLILEALAEHVPYDGVASLELRELPLRKSIGMANDMNLVLQDDGAMPTRYVGDLSRRLRKPS